MWGTGQGLQGTSSLGVCVWGRGGRGHHSCTASGWTVRRGSWTGRLQEPAVPPSVWALGRWPQPEIGDGKASHAEAPESRWPILEALLGPSSAAPTLYLPDLALLRIFSLPGSLLRSGALPLPQPLTTCLNLRASYSPQCHPSCLASVVNLLSWYRICMWGEGHLTLSTSPAWNQERPSSSPPGRLRQWEQEWR